MFLSRILREWVWRQYDKAEVVAHSQTRVGFTIWEGRRPSQEEVAANIARIEQRNREMGAPNYKLYLRPDGARDLAALVQDVGFPLFGLDGELDGLEPGGWGSSADSKGLDEITMGYSGSLGVVQITSRRSSLSRNPLRRWLDLAEHMHAFLQNDVWEPPSGLDWGELIARPTGQEVAQLARSTSATMTVHRSEGGSYVLATAKIEVRKLRTLRDHIVRLDQRPDSVSRLEAQMVEQHERFWRERGE